MKAEQRKLIEKQVQKVQGILDTMLYIQGDLATIKDLPKGLADDMIQAYGSLVALHDNLGLIARTYEVEDDDATT